MRVHVTSTCRLTDTTIVGPRTGGRRKPESELRSFVLLQCFHVGIGRCLFGCEDKKRIWSVFNLGNPTVFGPDGFISSHYSVTTLKYISIGVIGHLL